MNRRQFLTLGASAAGTLAGVKWGASQSRDPILSGPPGSLQFLHQPRPDEVSVLATGDSILYRFREEPRGPGYDELFRMQRDCDIAITNCEIVFSDKGYPKPKDIARARPATADALVWQGIDMVSLANNHAMDLGQDGLAGTIQTLEQRRIVFAGGGKNLAEAARPGVVTRKGIRIGLMSYLCMTSEVATDSAASADRPGVASIRGFEIRVPTDDGKVRRFSAPEETALRRMEVAIQEARPKVDVLLMAYHMHWGGRDVDEGRRIIARAAVDSGADVVLAHGPHVINPVEAYRGKLIFYSLGNFFFHIFDANAPAEFFGTNWPIRKSIYNFTTSTDYWEALAPRFVFGKDGLKRVQVLPISLDRSGNPRLPAPELGAAIVEDFRTMSQGMGAAIEIHDWYAEVKAKQEVTP